MGPNAEFDHFVSNMLEGSREVSSFCRVQECQKLSYLPRQEAKNNHNHLSFQLENDLLNVSTL